VQRGKGLRRGGGAAVFGLEKRGGRDAVAAAAAVVFGPAKRGEVTMPPLCLDLQRGGGRDAVAAVVFELAKEGEVAMPPPCLDLQRGGGRDAVAVAATVMLGLAKKG
jgi:hypothetical protein